MKSFDKSVPLPEFPLGLRVFLLKYYIFNVAMKQKDTLWGNDKESIPLDVPESFEWWGNTKMSRVDELMDFSFILINQTTTMKPARVFAFPNSGQSQSTFSYFCSDFCLIRRIR